LRNDAKLFYGGARAMAGDFYHRKPDAPYCSTLQHYNNKGHPSKKESLGPTSNIRSILSAALSAFG
jgi:hypothetical protein